MKEITHLTLTGGAGDDRPILDFSRGNPLSELGLNENATLDLADHDLIVSATHQTKQPAIPVVARR